MHKIHWLLLALPCLLATPAAITAQTPLHWELSLDRAKQLASQSHRLVLVEFSAPWCPQCQVMEREVFEQPGVGPAIEANYVPVRLNYDYNKQTAKQYGVTGLPTTVIIAPTPQGEVLDRLPGRMELVQYLAQLNRLALEARRREAALPAQISAGPPPAPAATPPAAPAAAAGAGGPQAVAVNRPPLEPAAAQASAPAARAGNPPLGLDGFCPVRLAEKKTWMRGDVRWGVVHQGQTYLFAGPDEQQRFYANPERYAPVNAGNDPVATVDRKQAVRGHRKHGLYYVGRVYLFADEANLRAFVKNPRFYAEKLAQPVRPASLTTAQK